MAIAKMKKMTLLAEQSDKEALLKAVQELQQMEIIPVSEEEEEEILNVMSDEEVDRSTRSYDEELVAVRHALSYINQFSPKESLIQRMKRGKESLTLQQLEAEVEKKPIKEWVDNISLKEKQFSQLEEERQALKEEEEFLRKWSQLSFLPSELASFNLMYGKVGTVNSEVIPEFRESLNEAGFIYFEELYQTRYDAAYLIIGPAEEKQTIDSILQEYQYAALEYRYEKLPSEELKRNLDEQKQLREQKKTYEKEIRGYKDAPRDLALAEEYYYNLSQRETAKTLAMNTNRLFLISGWMEEEKIPEMKQLIEETVGSKRVAILDDDVNQDEYQDVPIVLKNNAFVAPFETVTEMYSLPSYNEIDPTPIMAPFYVVFFGMMSGDLGYGLILFLATLAAIKFFNLSPKMEKNLKFFNFASLGTIGFGLFFGSFFGIALPFNVVSVMDDVIPLLVLSVVIGFVQMIVGLTINGVVKNKQGDKASSYVDGYAWVMILLGAALWILGSLVFNLDWLSTAGIILAVVNVIGILGVSMLTNKNKALGAALGAYNLYNVTGYVGDLVSYTRLMALAVSSASIAMAFNMIVQFLPTAARFTVGIVIIVLLHALNLFLTYLSAYVHTARLQYVEFFGKFYEGGGKKLNPFKTLEKHIRLDDREKQNKEIAN